MYVSGDEHYQVDVRFVHNPSAEVPTGGASWAEYEQDVLDTHRELLHRLQARVATAAAAPHHCAYARPSGGRVPGVSRAHISARRGPPPPRVRRS